MTEDEVPNAYATPEDVFELLNMTDSVTFEPLSPDNTTFPTRKWLEKRLSAWSDDFDASTHDTWREIQVVEHVFDRGSMWWLTNLAFYGAPMAQGGWASQLIRPIRPWDKDKGDRLYERKMGSNVWTDITDMEGSTFWFDYNGGVFYYTMPQAPVDSAFKITYRYGRMTKVPSDIRDAVAGRVAVVLMQTDWYRTKIGGGGDLSSKNDTIRDFKENYERTVYKHMNCGDAVSLYP